MKYIIGILIGLLLLGIGIYEAVTPGEERWISTLLIGLGLYMIIGCGYLLKKGK